MFQATTPGVLMPLRLLSFWISAERPGPGTPPPDKCLSALGGLGLGLCSVLFRAVPLHPLCRAAICGLLCRGGAKCNNERCLLHGRCADMPLCSRRQAATSSGVARTPYPVKMIMTAVSETVMSCPLRRAQASWHDTLHPNRYRAARWRLCTRNRPKLGSGDQREPRLLLLACPNSDETRRGHAPGTLCTRRRPVRPRTTSTAEPRRQPGATCRRPSSGRASAGRWPCRSAKRPPVTST